MKQRSFRGPGGHLSNSAWLLALLPGLSSAPAGSLINGFAGALYRLQ